MAQIVFPHRRAQLGAERGEVSPEGRHVWRLRRGVFWGVGIVGVHTGSGTALYCVARWVSCDGSARRAPGDYVEDLGGRMAADLGDAISGAREALAAGDAAAAWRALAPAPALSWPGHAVQERAELQRGMGAFGQVAAAVAGSELAGKVHRVVARPDDPQALYDAAYALYEAGVFGVAATLLHRANGIAPGQKGIVTELAACLEALGH